MSSSPYDVLVFGAGQIAAGYDAPYGESVLTHAHAIIKQPGFNLLGFYDIDFEKAEQSAQKWGCRAYDEPVTADVIAICTPDDRHLESVSMAVSLHPKLIILEKPIARSLEDALGIIRTAGEIPVQVNFTRRFVQEFQELAVNVREFGAFLTGTGLYGKGFIHNGSHMIDLLRLLIGEIRTIETLSEMFDFYDDDATKTVRISFDKGGEFYMRGIDCRHYSIFELELCFEKARVRMLDSGKSIQIDRVMPSPQYSGYDILTPAEQYSTGLSSAMLNLYKNAYEHLTHGSDLLLPIKSAIVKGLYIQ